MMKKILFALSLLLLFVSCGGDKEKKTVKKQAQTGYTVKDLNTKSPDCDQYVLMSTSLGDIKIKLYRETPLHRKNFINLVMNGYYDGQIFYRVVPGSIIQAGDYKTVKTPDMRDAGLNDVDYTIPAEIDPAKRIHKRGALAAASYNKGEYSSGSHFYIISHKKIKDSEIAAAEKTYTNSLVNKKFIEIQKPYAKELANLRAFAETGDNAKKREHDKKVQELMAQARKSVKEFRYPQSQRSTYTKQGGMPSLDPHYTVFGEVVEGMDVVDKISSVSVRDGRPRENVFIKKVTVINDNK
jgi:cyclophilin family peptidyl-prolyl cis-trans isomerase